MRFSASDYSTENIEDNYIHLTNNSIGKTKQGVEDDPDQEFYGKNMWSSSKFAEWLNAKEGYDVYS